MMTQLENFSKKLVDATSPLLGGRTVNIMNTQGIIIASSEKERIGTFHQGAFDVISTGKENLIYPDEVEKYPGAKQGINMPIKVKNEIIGVVGVFGNPDDIRDLANLLRVYVELWFKQLSKADKTEIEDEMRSKLLRQIIFEGAANKSYMQQLSKSIGWKPHPPYRLTVIKLDIPSDHISHTMLLRDLMRNIASSGFVDPAKDLYGMTEGGIVILKGLDDDGGDSMFPENLQKHIEREFKGNPVIVIGGLCRRLEELSAVYKGLRLVADCGQKGVIRLDSYRGMLFYIFENMSRDTLIKKFCSKMYEKLKTSTDEKTLKGYMDTLRAYYDSGKNLKKASEELFIHKNTLSYRLGKIYDSLDMKGESSFSEDVFLKLLISSEGIRPGDGGSDNL